jgi:glycosyltransferase involved in cell wall biosynthesis
MTVNVLHVLGELRASGAEVMLQTASDLWSTHDIGCDVLAIGQVPGAFAPVLEAGGYGVHHLPFSGDVSFLHAYRRLIVEGSYEVVHVHPERAFVYMCAVGRMSGARVVRTVHNNFPFDGALAQRRRWQRRLIRQLGVPFIAVGTTVADNEWQRFKNPTVHVDNWINVQSFVPPSASQRLAARQELAIAPSSTVVATVGNCSPVKNHATLLEALALLDEIDWTWVHVGDEGTEQHERGLATALGVESRCRFLGRIHPLSALYAADVFAMPSLYEGFALATLEALSTGLPAILTDVPGSRDLRGVSNRISWADTHVESLFDALRVAAQDSQTDPGDSIRHEQHQAIAARFSPETGVAAYARIYRGDV